MASWSNTKSTPDSDAVVQQANDPMVPAPTAANANRFAATSQQRAASPNPQSVCSKSSVPSVSVSRQPAPPPTTNSCSVSSSGSSSVRKQQGKAKLCELFQQIVGNKDPKGAEQEFIKKMSSRTYRVKTFFTEDFAEADVSDFIGAVDCPVDSDLKFAIYVATVTGGKERVMLEFNVFIEDWNDLESLPDDFQFDFPNLSPSSRIAMFLAAANNCGLLQGTINADAKNTLVKFLTQNCFISATALCKQEKFLSTIGYFANVFNRLDQVPDEEDKIFLTVFLAKVAKLCPSSQREDQLKKENEKLGDRIDTLISALTKSISALTTSVEAGKLRAEASLEREKKQGRYQGRQRGPPEHIIADDDEIDLDL